MGDNYITCSYEKGSISISDDVIAVVASAALTEVEGVAETGSTVGNEIADFLGKKSSVKGIKVDFRDEQIIIDAFIMVRFGYPVTDVAEKVQNAIVGSVEAMTGLGTPVVNVHVSGVAFDK